MCIYAHPDIPRTTPMGLQILFIVNHFQVLVAENNRNKLQLVQLRLFGVGIVMQVADSNKPQSVFSYFSAQLTKNVSKVHLELY